MITICKKFYEDWLINEEIAMVTGFVLRFTDEGPLLKGPNKIISIIEW